MPVHSDHRLALGIATLLELAAVALAGSERLPGGVEDARAAGQDRPNIVLIQTDDQTARELSARVMPNTERLLGRRGTTFGGYVVTTAQCCPSRASLLTGQYAHNHGVTSNNVGYPGLVDKENVLPAWLQRVGYHTIHVGKFLNGYQRFADAPSEVAPGWEEWHTVHGSSQYYDYNYFVNGGVAHHGTQPGDHVTHVLNRDAVTLVKQYAPRGLPFYLQLDERAPHVGGPSDPFGDCGGAAFPKPADEGLFADARLPKPPSFNESDMTDKPAFLKGAPRLGAVEQAGAATRWRCALASLAGVDRGVRKVYEAIRAAGELRKTVFVFVSDNGFFFGEHRINRGKVFPYEEASRQPLLIRLPRRYRDGAQRVRHVGKPVANIDLAPTILDLAGAEPCARGNDCRTMDGRSLMPLLTRSGGWRRGRGVLTEYREPNLGRYSTCEFAGTRTRRAIYTEHYRVVDPSTGNCVDSTPPQAERYDLKSDPFELENLCFGGVVGSCPTDAQQLDLEVRLATLRDCAGVAGRDRRVGGQPFCE